jgi:NADH dehydrogenase FAD-containing subunit
MTHPTSHKVLILGGGYAGLMAASRIARGSSSVEVTLIDARPTFTQRIRLHETLAGRKPATFDYAPLLRRRGVRFVQARVESLDPGRHRVLARSLDGSPVEHRYDTLVLALGSHTRASVPGVAEHAVRLDDPAALREAAARTAVLANTGGRVLVAGGGLTGIESATELAERYPNLRVTLATRGRVGDDYSEAGSAHLRHRLIELGVEILDDTGIAGLEPGRALLADGGQLPFGLCVWVGGFEAPALAREAGLSVDFAGRALVDPALRAQGHPDVFVAGDAAVATLPDGHAIRMGCVSAMPLGAHAGESLRRVLAGREPEPFAFGFVIRCISLGRKDGLVQSVEPDDTPLPRVKTRLAARITKELIGRMTYGVPQWELRTGARLYRWPGPGRPLVQSDAHPSRV